MHRDEFWHSLARYGIGASLAIGTLVGLAGFVAWLRIADPHWRAIGVAHMTAYLMVAVLLVLSLVLRMVTPVTLTLAITLSGVAIALLLSSTWTDEELGQAYRQRHSVFWMS